MTILRKPKNEKDVKYILKNLRSEDKHECIVQIGKKYQKKILKDIMTSNQYFVLGCDKKYKPIAMGGVTEVTSGIGIVWLLSTPDILKNQISFLNEMKKEIEKLDEKYWLTYNIIFKDNFIAKKWLKKNGYRFPQEEKNKTSMDKQLLKNTQITEDFELFYRLRKVRGLK